MSRIVLAVNGHEWDALVDTRQLPPDLITRIERIGFAQIRRHHMARNTAFVLGVLCGAGVLLVIWRGRFYSLTAPLAILGTASFAVFFRLLHTRLLLIRGETCWNLDLRTHKLDPEMAYFLDRIPSGSPLVADFLRAIRELRSYEEMMKVLDRSLDADDRREGAADLRQRLAEHLLQGDPGDHHALYLEDRIADAEEFGTVQAEVRERTAEIVAARETLRKLARLVSTESTSIDLIKSQVDSLISGLDETCGHLWRRAKEIKSSQTT